MPNSNFYETKLTNAANWLERTVERHSGGSQEVMEVITPFISKLREDEGGLRANFLNPQFRGVMVEQCVPLREALNGVREWFHFSEAERNELVEDKIRYLERVHTNFGNWIEVLKKDKELTSADLRTLGAYVEIFFGVFLDAAKK